MHIVTPDSFVSALDAADPQMRRLIRRFAADSADIDDLLQDTRLLAWSRRSQYSGRGSSAGWLLRLCRTVCVRWLSRSKRGVPVDPALVPDTAGDPQEAAACAQQDVGDDDRLTSILNLAPRARRIVLMYYLEGLSTGDVASHLGIASGTVRASLAQSRLRLRENDRLHQLNGDD